MEFSSLASLGTPPFYIVANFTRFVKGAVLFLPPILGGGNRLSVSPYCGSPPQFGR